MSQAPIGDPTPLRLAVIQRVCTSYRVHLFRKLARQDGIRLRLIVGDDVPNSKVRNAGDLSDLDVEKLPSRFLALKGRTLIDHQGILPALSRFRPHVILCEGESNLLSNLKVLAFRLRHPYVGLIHWSLGGLPGAPMVRNGIRGSMSNWIRRQFDAFVVYSSYGKRVLLANGFAEDRVFVATNVGDLSRHSSIAETLSKQEVRKRLGLPNRFVVLFVGAMTDEKRLDVLLDAAEKLDPERFSVIMIGDGEMLPLLRREKRRRALGHVHLTGRVSAELPLYYRAANVMVLPGRGGMVISEAMAYGLSVIAYRADGTEYDLIRDGQTGILLSKGTPEELRRAIWSMSEDSEKAAEWGRQAQLLVKERFTTEHMVERILAAVHQVRRIKEPGELRQDF